MPGAVTRTTTNVAFPEVYEIHGKVSDKELELDKTRQQGCRFGPIHQAAKP